MTTTSVVTDLGYREHGLSGVSLCVVGNVQYALGLCEQVNGRTYGEVYRRTVYAGDTLAYGGWRWECSPDHLMRYPTTLPEVTDALARLGYTPR